MKYHRHLGVLLACLLAVSLAQEQRVRSIAVKFTAYNAQSAQTDADPSQSACGPTVPGQVAVSPDLSQSLPCGSHVLIELPGRPARSHLVNDRTASRKTRQIDILMPTRRQALKFGVRYGQVQVSQ